ncbi:beta-glucosidase [Agreia bicolorata]|uniref:Exo-alpha-(1->6)-L-arabinopyranosidase n=1 Tax=Agreia bicolorata TaxID=110935 RepID=A0A1T4WSF5_9MICO|nr:glycoside hydrolase family 3 N-terminal domain-containing protein [Agreia bicolorata]KJC64229.1 glycoside hydrolase [Agreia bicolorata]SKA80254.1 beta-glucosidase [Agreia bicolorata]
MSQHLYQNPTASTSERVADLLGRMTLEEKAGQLTQYFYFGSFGEAPADIDIDALPPEHRQFVGQPAMVRDAIARGATGSVLFVREARMANVLQRSAVEDTRLGIPLIFGFDVVHGHRTVFPVPIAQAASWDPDAVEESQRTAGREARASGIHWTFAPMVDIGRDPRWGRIVEGAGEDPHLGAAMAAAQVRGFQGSFGPESILAGPKHFAAYGAARGGRDYDEVEVSDSELRNVYLPPFAAAIEAGAANVMSAYMELNGVPASGNRWLLRDVLRDELGFTGFVVSDANAVRSLTAQHFAADLTDAAVRAVTAGLDMEMCMFDPAFASVPEAVRAGLVEESAVDESVTRILAVKFDLGLFESPYANEEAEDAVLAAPEHRDRARAMAESSAVLLKNDGLLPLQLESLGSIAVIGELADSKRDTLGPWVFSHDTDETITIVEGIRARVAGAAEVRSAFGAGIPSRLFASDFDQHDPTVVGTPDDYDDDAAIEQAVALAADSDVAVVVVGQRQNQIGETASSSTLALPGRQLEQLQRIAETGTPVVLLVMSGRPLDLRWPDVHIPSILEIWYPGTRGGDAVAALLFGDVSPAGRLPFTWPRHVGQVPIISSHLRTFQPENQGKRYWDEESTSLYPFGYGLSYATFTYGDVQLERASVEVGETVAVTVDVTNTSDVAADEVAQLYIHQRHGRAARPVRELKGFQRVHLEAGESRTLTFALGPEQLRYWSAADRGWVQDATTIELGVGPSSATALNNVLTITPTAAR